MTPAERLARWLEAGVVDRRSWKFYEVVGGGPSERVALELSEGRRIVAWIEGPSVEAVTDTAVLVAQGAPIYGGGAVDA